MSLAFREQGNLLNSNAYTEINNCREEIKLKHFSLFLPHTPASFLLDISSLNLVCSLKPDSKGSLLGTLVEQASLKPTELEKHLVWNQTQLLLRTLDQHSQSTRESSTQTNFVKAFLDYITTLAAVVLRSLNAELGKGFLLESLSLGGDTHSV